jgi:pyruvate dehydrogenase E2 component (dihydrolipoamide acetyltransferase)
LIAEGTAIPARTVLALIGSAADTLPAVDPYYRVAGRTQAPVAVAPEPVIAVSEPNSERTVVLASPRARKLAAEHGVDLASLTGTGPGGRIVEEDVLRAVERG